MNWGALGPDYLVKSERFYIHNRANPPEIDKNTWTLEVSGLPASWSTTGYCLSIQRQRSLSLCT